MNIFFKILYLMFFAVLTLALLKLFLSILLAGFLLLWFRTWQIQRNPSNKIFLNGTVPNPKPDGLYRGIFLGHNTSWKGKKLNAEDSSGINIFDDGKGGSVEKYPFKTYVGKGLSDKKLSVLKIDYNVSGNPFWLKFVVDEVMQVAPNEYLGKMHLKIIPGLPFSILYFQLKK